MANDADAIDLMNENTRLKAEVERLRIGTAALSANLRVAQAAEEKAEAEVERQVQVAARLASEAACERIRAEKAEAELAAEREESAENHDLYMKAVVERDTEREKHAEELERLRAALQGIIANGHEQVENRAGDLYCVEACAACAADAALRVDGE